MAKVKNKRENHTTKRGTYGYGYGPKETADGGRGGQRSGRRRLCRAGMTVGENLLPQTAKDATPGFLRWIAKIAMRRFLRRGESRSRQLRTSDRCRVM